MKKQEGSKKFSLRFRVDFAELRRHFEWGMLAYPLTGLAFGLMSGWAMFIVAALVGLSAGWLGTLLPLWVVVGTVAVFYIAGLAVVLKAEIKGIALGSKLTEPRVYLILISFSMIGFMVGHLNW